MIFLSSQASLSIKKSKKSKKIGRLGIQESRYDFHHRNTIFEVRTHIFEEAKSQCDSSWRGTIARWIWKDF
jgi:hypothetical protein